MKPSLRSGCAYCGAPSSTVDHVVSRALYPQSKSSSRLPRITVPACQACNGGWADDEPHFRNVLMVAGAPNAAVYELWVGKVRRSFHNVDGHRRVRELAAEIEPIEVAGEHRHIIYPARDQRVLRIVRKVVRGLCHHHGLLSPVTDGQIFADTQRFAIPDQFVGSMTSAHAEADILEYKFGLVEEEDLHSGWLLTFYERTRFLCLVFRSEAARRRAAVASLSHSA